MKHRTIRLLLFLMLAVGLSAGLSIGYTVSAQTAPTGQRASNEQVKNLLERLERSADSFRASLQESLTQTSFNSTRAEDNINDFVKEFEAATDRLKDRFSDNNAATAAVQDVLQRAAAINSFMNRQPLTARAQSEWDYLRTNLNELARIYNVRWVWPGVAATRPYRVNEEQMENLLQRVEQKSDTFRSALKNSLEQTRFDDSKAEDNINQFVRDFERATDRLEERFDDDTMATGAATEVLRRAVIIDRFLQRNKLTPVAQNAWRNLRSDLDELARNYNFAMNWNAPTIVIQVLVPQGQVAERARRP